MGLHVDNLGDGPGRVATVAASLWRARATWMSLARPGQGWVVPFDDLCDGPRRVWRATTGVLGDDFVLAFARAESVLFMLSTEAGSLRASRPP